MKKEVRSQLASFVAPLVQAGLLLSNGYFNHHLLHPSLLLHH
jgi:hypothetical protein